MFFVLLPQYVLQKLRLSKFYSFIPWRFWSSGSEITAFHSTLSCACSLHILTPSYLKSLSTFSNILFVTFLSGFTLSLHTQSMENGRLTKRFVAEQPGGRRLRWEKKECLNEYSRSDQMEEDRKENQSVLTEFYNIKILLIITKFR